MNGNDVIAPTAAKPAITFPPFAMPQSGSSFSLPFPCCRCNSSGRCCRHSSSSSSSSSSNVLITSLGGDMHSHERLLFIICYLICLVTDSLHSEVKWLEKILQIVDISIIASACRQCTVSKVFTANNNSSPSGWIRYLVHILFSHTTLYL